MMVNDGGADGTRQRPALYVWPACLCHRNLVYQSSHAFSSPITFLANFECSRPKYESATAAKTLEAEAQLR